jgi:uncharacterized iron-regulated protein
MAGGLDRFLGFLIADRDLATLCTIIHCDRRADCLRAVRSLMALDQPVALQHITDGNGGTAVDQHVL